VQNTVRRYVAHGVAEKIEVFRAQGRQDGYGLIERGTIAVSISEHSNE
jgi:hypothetical protein